MDDSLIYVLGFIILVLYFSFIVTIITSSISIYKYKKKCEESNKRIAALLKDLYYENKERVKN